MNRSGTRGASPGMLRVSLLGGGATVVGQLPAFLVGAMAVQLTDELAFGAAGLGAAIGAFRLAAAAAARFLGGLVDRLGARSSLRLAASLAVLASLGIALTARSWWSLAAWLVVAACANSLAQPAANRLLVNRVPSGRQGLGFGIKQSALPTASLLAGVSVPLLAVTVGWRWAYVAGAALAVVVLVAVRSIRPAAGRSAPPGPASGGRGRLRDPATLVILAVGVGCATAATNTVPAFYVVSAVREGMTSELAGTLLAVASLGAISARVIFGAVADRLDGGHLRMCAGMVLVGSTGMLALVAGGVPLMAVGVVVALTFAWGMDGVFWFAVVRSHPESPGRVTGAVMPGGLIGGTLGPVAFGVIAESVGYTAGWAMVLLLAGAAGVILWWGAARLAAARRDAPGAASGGGRP